VAHDVYKVHEGGAALADEGVVTMYFTDVRVDLAHGRLADRLADADRARQGGLARRSRSCPDQSTPSRRRRLRLPAAWRRPSVVPGQAIVARRESLASAWDC
jgi:hypothetical protein